MVFISRKPFIAVDTSGSSSQGYYAANKQMKPSSGNSLVRQPNIDLFQSVRFGTSIETVQSQNDPDGLIAFSLSRNPFQKLAKPGLIAYDATLHKWYYTGDLKAEREVPEESRQVGKAIISHMLGTRQAEKLGHDTSEQVNVYDPHPCLGGKRSIKENQFRFAVYPSFDTKESLFSFLYDLNQYVEADSHYLDPTFTGLPPRNGSS